MADLYVSSLAAGGGSGTEASPYTLTEWMQNATAGDVGWVKADGTYSSIGSGTAFSNSGTQASPIVTNGYGTVPGDRVRPTLDGCIAWTPGGAFTRWFDLKVTGNTSVNLVEIPHHGVAARCSFINSGSGSGFDLGSYGVAVGCYSYGGKGPGSYTRAAYISCYLEKGGSDTGYIVGNSNFGASIQNCVLVGNGLCAGIAYSTTIDYYANAEYSGNVIYNVTDGIVITGTQKNRGFSIINNVIYDCSGYGIDVSGLTEESELCIYGNAMGALTSGRVNGLTTTEELDPITLTGDPFVDSAGGDFRLNDVPGAGRACRHMRLRPPAA